MGSSVPSFLVVFYFYTLAIWSFFERYYTQKVGLAVLSCCEIPCPLYKGRNHKNVDDERRHLISTRLINQRWQLATKQFIIFFFRFMSWLSLFFKKNKNSWWKFLSRILFLSAMKKTLVPDKNVDVQCARHGVTIFTLSAAPTLSNLRKENNNKRKKGKGLRLPKWTCFCLELHQQYLNMYTPY